MAKLISTRYDLFIEDKAGLHKVVHSSRYCWTCEDGCVFYYEDVAIGRV